ncbi:MAG: hypothetical protein Sapg2KO_27510 [Saprospiraceae bacterium]
MTKKRAMKKEKSDQKIGHPFQVPDHFFETFQSDIMERVASENYSRESIIKLLTLKFGRYAALLLLLFFAGKGAWQFVEKPAAITTERVAFDKEIEAIYFQISEEDLIDFITEDMSENFIKQLDF